MSFLKNNSMHHNTRCMVEEEEFEDDIHNTNKANNNSSFNPNFYNPFEIKHRRRTSKGQFKILEKAFIDNPKPNAKIRQGLAESLSMTPRGVQVWFQNRRAKAKQQQQQQQQEQYKKNHDDIDNLRVSSSPIVLSSSGMVHSRSQSSLSSSTTYSTGNDNTHVIKSKPMEVIQSSLLLTPPQQEQDEWWNNIITGNHQTFNPAAMTDPFTTSNAATTTGATGTAATAINSTEHLDAWAYIDSLDINQSFVENNKINVEDWISSTTKDLSDNRRHSFPSNNNNIQQNNSFNWAGHQEVNNNNIL